VDFVLVEPPTRRSRHKRSRHERLSDRVRQLMVVCADSVAYSTIAAMDSNTNPNCDSCHCDSRMIHRPSVQGRLARGVVVGIVAAGGV